MSRNSIVFVCHSTGGIVVRYLLESNWAQFKDKRVGLVLIASPSYGSTQADKVKARLEPFSEEERERVLASAPEGMFQETI